MTVLELHGVGVRFAGSAAIFESVSLVLRRGFYGLVGANGAGKTTLLSLLAGELAPHEGRLATTSSAVVAFCRQTVDACSSDIAELGERRDGWAAEMRERLGLSPADLERWESLSPGERKRWQIAGALSAEPDILLLDEPTNHLDTDGQKKLVEALRRYKGVAVLVSHDRRLLDALTTTTLRIFERQVSEWPGGYSEAKARWEKARAEQEAGQRRARERVHALQGQLAEAKRNQAAATRGKSAGRRMKDKNDSDARGILATNKAEWAESRAGRVVASTQRELARARAAVTEMTRDKTLGAKVFAAFERAPKATLLHLDQTELRRGEHVVLRDVRLTIQRDDRLRIRGPNGAGKTTLLEALVRAAPRADKVLYLPQELPRTRVHAALDRLHALSPAARGEWLSIFAALGSDPAPLLLAQAHHLSPGEARKLILAEALSRQVWALILDEPTNHLDVPSIERLEAALCEYPGCLVVVTHDELLGEKVSSKSLSVGGGQLK